MDATNSQLGELQDALLLSYEAQNPNIVHLYPQAIANPGKYVVIYVYKIITLDVLHGIIFRTIRYSKKCFKQNLLSFSLSLSS